MSIAVSSEAWAKFRVWASVTGRGWLLLSGSVAYASLETAVSTHSGDVVRKRSMVHGYGGTRYDATFSNVEL